MSIPAPTNDAIATALRYSNLSLAESLARDRISVHPDDSYAQVLLGVSLAMQKRPHEAAAVYRELIDREPDEPTHYLNLGSALRETSDLDGAEAAYRHGLTLAPQDAGGLADLGSLRWQRGDAVETRELMLKAWKIDPEMPEPRIYGAPACVKCDDNESARMLLDGCENWTFLGATLEAELSATLIQVDRFDEAERRLRALLKIPEAVGLATLRLAALLERVNRLDEAEALLVGTQVADVDWIEERALRATLTARRGNHSAAIPLYMDALAGQPEGINNVDSMFALATAYDRTGDAAMAMETLSRAHRVQLQHAGRLMPMMLEEDSDPLNIDGYNATAEWYRNWQADPQAPATEQSPIFIVGFPRSGTTLLEQMIEAHPGVRSMDERAFLQEVLTRMQLMGYPNYPEDLDKLDGSEISSLRDVYWKCVDGVLKLEPGERLLDKNPLNILKLPMIHRLFPNARIILALRHPCDVVLSNYMQCFHAPAYQILCSSFERLARGYANAMNLWMAHAKTFDAKILELRYEDLLDDVQTQTRRIAEHLKLDDPSALYGYREQAIAKGFISTPSYSEVILPLSKKAVGRWRRYEESLRPVLPRLKTAIDHWGYEA